MKYFFDTEFIEGFKKPIKWLPTIGNFNKPCHSIQLISIGIVCEDGREYYAISNEYNYNDASEWVKENVIANIYREQIAAFKQQFMNIATFHKYIPNGKSNKQIANEVSQFILDPNGKGLDKWLGSSDDYFRCLKEGGTVVTPEFYAYFADYDWVLFCSIFGTMMDLPKGFPMYCRDLKQLLDEKAMAQKGWTKDADAEFRINAMKNDLELGYEYPKQTNEHNALADAKWNYELYKFLQTI